MREYSENYLDFDTTLVLYTYNRPTYFHRALSYCANLNRSVYILDGSPKNREKIVASYKESNFIYIHRPIESAWDRYLSFLPDIKTPYVMFMPDDVFFFEESIDACVGFLNSNPDYSAATTPLIAFQESQGVIDYSLMYHYVNDLDINDNDPIERFKKFCSKIVYTVQYTVVRREVIEKMLETGFHELTTSIAEMLYLFVILLLGKVRVVSVPGFVRGLVPRRVSATVEDFFNKPSYANAVHQFQLRMGRFLSQYGLNAADTIPEIVNAFNHRYSGVSGGYKGLIPLYRTIEGGAQPEMLSPPLKEYPYHTPHLMKRLMKMDAIIREHKLPQDAQIEGATKDVNLSL